MATLTAKRNPIVVASNDLTPYGGTFVSYTKAKSPDENLWQKQAGNPDWEWIKKPEELYEGTTSDTEGIYPINLYPGQMYEIAILVDGTNPNVPEHLARAHAHLIVFCIRKVSERTLITDQNSRTGGTWHEHDIATSVDTAIARIGASRSPILFNDAGMPVFEETDGEATIDGVFTQSHSIEITPLFAGWHYHFAAMVVDESGNWDVLSADFDTLAREAWFTFINIRVTNDSDKMTDGDAEFWFSVGHKFANGEGEVLKDFHLPTFDIDDNDGTGRFYSVNRSYHQPSHRVHETQRDYFVNSWAREHDALGYDRGGTFAPHRLTPPDGKYNENSIQKDAFTFKCYPRPDDGELHYDVFGTWTVKYVP